MKPALAERKNVKGVSLNPQQETEFHSDGSRAKNYYNDYFQRYRQGLGDQ